MINNDFNKIFETVFGIENKSTELTRILTAEPKIKLELMPSENKNNIFIDIIVDNKTIGSITLDRFQSRLMAATLIKYLDL